MQSYYIGHRNGLSDDQDYAIIAIVKSNLTYEEVLKRAEGEYPQHSDLVLVSITDGTWNYLAHRGYMTHEFPPSP